MNPLFLLSGIGMMAVGVVAAVYWKVSRGVPWRLFFWGALAWVVGVTAKFIVAMPLNKPLFNTCRAALPGYLAEPLWDFRFERRLIQSTQGLECTFGNFLSLNYVNADEHNV